MKLNAYECYLSPQFNLTYISENWVCMLHDIPAYIEETGFKSYSSHSVLPQLSENFQHYVTFLKIRTEEKTLAEKGPVPALYLYQTYLSS